ncbi:hypothetical Protein YC6258_03349 [Gynuella sunshinyii YC6258]|uniref:Uncharacterized protein n=1 Tax=Gynuella sunshinyii YC6258 TaxID=1445510 RepID=A0A0C5VM49_9GAMM|nr:hypothetical Protein YC6258_03349 [Gynuella sunshinyii YC6258]
MKLPDLQFFRKSYFLKIISHSLVSKFFEYLFKDNVMMEI